MITNSESKKMVQEENCLLLLTDFSEVPIYGTYWVDPMFYGFWTKLLARWENGQNLVTNRQRVDLIHSSHILNTCNIDMWRNTAQQCRSRLFQDWFLQETLKTRNQHQEESCAFSEVTRLCQQVGCARYRFWSPIVLQMLKSFLGQWDLAIEETDSRGLSESTLCFDVRRVEFFPSSTRSRGSVCRLLEAPREGAEEECFGNSPREMIGKLVTSHCPKVMNAWKRRKHKMEKASRGPWVEGGMITTQEQCSWESTRWKNSGTSSWTTYLLKQTRLTDKLTFNHKQFSSPPWSWWIRYEGVRMKRVG